ncbi:MAG: hypothetical protein KER_03034 [Kerstersia gyiorum]|uniref:hypothetical protein n=1 Tax=Kerstersia gyiorum TaxID=206506 RepID=UPI0030D5F343
MTLTTEMIRAGQDAAPQLSAVEIAAVWRAMCAAAPVAAQAQPDARTVDEVVSGLYRKFKEWSKRGFGPDDVTWCEVRAAVMELVNVQGQQPVSGADRLPPFAEMVIEKLARANECFSDGQGADIGRHWLDMLTRLGLLNLVQANPAMWEITAQGEDVLRGQAAQAKPSINTGELESVADKLFAEAYQAGMDGDEFDVLRAKRLIARAALAARASANICNADKRQIPASQLQARGLDKDNIDAARAAEKEH